MDAQTERLPDDIDLVDEDEDPFGDDLDERLAAAAPRRLANRSTYVLAGVVLLAAGFLAGAVVEKHYGAPAAAAGVTGTAPTGAAAFPGAGNRRGTGNAGTGNTGTGNMSTTPITGTVKLVDGSTVYIDTPDGRVVIVKTTATTAVQLTSAGSLKDLRAGSTVTVEGTDDNGTFNATRVTTPR